MLAVSSLGTYGILLAGFPFFTYLHTKNTKNTQYTRSNYLSQYFNKSIKKTVKVSLAGVSQKCFIHTSFSRNNESNNSNINKEQFISDLFKDRIAPVIPFDRDLIKGSCSNYTNKISRTTFLKD